MHRYAQSQHAVWLRSPVGVALLLALVVLTLYLLTEHTSHLFAFLPFGIILLCPLLHLVMMRGMHDGHGGHSGHREHADAPPRS